MLAFKGGANKRGYGIVSLSFLFFQRLDGEIELMRHGSQCDVIADIDISGGNAMNKEQPRGHLDETTPDDDSFNPETV